MHVRKCIPAQSCICALMRDTILEEMRREIFFISNDCGGAYQFILGRDSQTNKSVDPFCNSIIFLCFRCDDVLPLQMAES